MPPHTCCLLEAREHTPSYQVESLCSSEGGEGAQLPRLAEMRPSALPTEAADGLLWRDVAAASRPASLPPGPPGPPPGPPGQEAAVSQACCSYASATASGLSPGTWAGGGAEAEQGLELSARAPAVSDLRAAQAHVDGGSLRFGCFSGYGEGAPSATSLWEPGGAPSAASGAAPLPLSQHSQHSQPPPYVDEPSAVASRVEHELRLRVAQLEDRAAAAEHSLASAEQENQRLRQRSDLLTAGQQAELSRRMAIIQEQHDQHHRALHERIAKAEADLDSMLLEPLLESSATLEAAQRASSEAGQQLLLLEERGAALATAEASRRDAEQQRAVLSSLAAEIREALGAQHTRNPAARLQQLQQSMREWLQRASHAASGEWLQGSEADGTAARPRRTMVAAAGLASRALGDALAGSTLPPTWQPQPPPKSAEQVWFAQEEPAAAEAKVLVSDVADNCAASGLVRRGDRVRNIYPGCSRMYPGLQPYAP